MTRTFLEDTTLGPRYCPWDLLRCVTYDAMFFSRLYWRSRMYLLQCCVRPSVVCYCLL